MPLALYLDHNVPPAIVRGLRRREVDVLTAYEDGAHELEDPDVLDRAALRERVLFSMDSDFLVEGARRQREGIPFRGIVYAHPLQLSIGDCIRDLEIIAKVEEPEDLQNRVIILPL